MDSAGERFEAIRTALADRSNVLTVKELCQLAGVSRSGYYNWMSSQRARELREERDRAAFRLDMDLWDAFCPYDETRSLLENLESLEQVLTAARQAAEMKAEQGVI